MPLANDSTATKKLVLKLYNIAVGCRYSMCKYNYTCNMCLKVRGK